MTAHVINLISRPDRWAQAEKELSPYFELTRVDAVKATPGWIGLKMTQEALFHSLYGPALIFEDDATWLGGIDPNVFIQQLPPDFDMLMFGANIKHPKLERFSPNLVRTFGSWTAHAVYYSEQLIQELRGINMTLPYDEYFRTVIHPRGNSYVTDPFMSVQRRSFSDIEGYDMDYSNLFKASAERVRRAK